MTRNRFRALAARLPGPDKRRVVVLTGARQTGKTVLAGMRYPDLRYLNLDDLELRATLRDLPAVRWAREVGPAVLDEAQKEPAVFDKVKLAFDAGDVSFSVLLGSSRFLLLDRVRETLAGRAFVFELWPLMPCEVAHAVSEPAPPPLLDALVRAPGPIGDVLREQLPRLLPEPDTAQRDAFEHVYRWGGMPELLGLDAADRREWLRSYTQTFLERDLADLVRLADLEPFTALQKLAMLRSGRLLSYADLARDAGISPKTAQRYVEFLRVSYQVLLLPPFARNLTSRLVKAPKLYWVDMGLLRHGTRQWQDAGGELFETAVVVEIHKWLSTSGSDAALSFYRTTSGMEVDLLLETGAGILGVEVKDRDRGDSRDLRGMRAVAARLGAEWRGGLVVHHGEAIECLDAPLDAWAVPAHRLFG